MASAAIKSRSTATVESRSSHRAIGKSVRLARLRAKERVDCARGPSDPSMLSGRPSTKPTARRSAASSEDAVGVGGEGLARDGFDAGRELAVRIGGRDSDCLGAKIEADQGAARRQMRSGFFERQDQCRHGRVSDQHWGVAPAPDAAKTSVRLIIGHAITMLSDVPIHPM